MRIAAIDVGTNSVHLLVADIHADGTYAVVEKARRQVELGSGAMATRRLTPEAIQRLMGVVDKVRSRSGIR